MSTSIGLTAGVIAILLVISAFFSMAETALTAVSRPRMHQAFGAWMGWQLLLPIVLLSAATGAVIGIVLIIFRGRDRQLPIPFGPYLAAAGWIAMMWGPQITHDYLRMTGLGHA